MCSRSRENAGSTMEPEPTDFRPQLTDEQWALIADLLQNRRRIPAAAVPG